MASPSTTTLERSALPCPSAPAYDIADDGLGSEPEADQDLAERLPALLLLDERDAHLIGADHALLDQQLPDARRALDLVHARASIPNIVHGPTVISPPVIRASVVGSTAPGCA